VVFWIEDSHNPTYPTVIFLMMTILACYFFTEHRHTCFILVQSKMVVNVL
jgi:hypothetical protein